MNTQDWTVNIPLSDLQKLLASVDQMEEMSAKVKQMGREITGLRQVQSDIISVIADIKKEL